jgi:hypothetical protein
MRSDHLSKHTKTHGCNDKKSEQNKEAENVDDNKSISKCSNGLFIQSYRERNTKRLHPRTQILFHKNTHFRL